jgi:hypothetical protein
MDSTLRYPCPCCGYLTLLQPPPGTNSICPICFWEDAAPGDPVRHVTSNRVHLLQAQRNFLAFGACEPEWLDIVCHPTVDDVRAPGWQPIDEAVRAERHILLTRFNPSASALQLWLRARVDDAMLQEIALADYGQQADINLLALRHFRDDGVILSPARHGGWHAVEVLELVRWSEPDDPTWKPGRTGIGGHLMRAFCCAVLLRAAAEPQAVGHFGGESETVIQLIASALTLGRDAAEGALRLLCWRMLVLPVEDEDGPFFATGILLLAAALHRAAAEGPLLRRLSEWVLAEEGRARAWRAEAWHDTPERWLFGLTYLGTKKDGSAWYGEQKIAQWRRVARQVLFEPPEPHPLEAAPTLRDIGARLVFQESTPADQRHDAAE